MTSDIIIKNLLLNEITKYLNTKLFLLPNIEFTTDCVYGKEVRVLSFDQEREEYRELVSELKNLYITIKLPSDFEKRLRTGLSVFEILETISDQIDVLPPIIKSDEKIYKNKVYQLCDWRLLEDEQGRVIKDNKITFVKYATWFPENNQ